MPEYRAYDSDPDRLLVEQAASGDMVAFEQLVQQYEQWIFHIILRITKIREDAEDQTQETLIRAYRGLKYFQGNSKFKTWLTQIAINQALMCLRKRHYNFVPFIHPSSGDREDPVLLDVADPGLNPEQQWAQTQLANRLEHEINRLPETLRSAFVLRCVHEYTSMEAAITLEISSHAVKSRVLRARRRIRERLDNRGQGTCESTKAGPDY
jgi:RNA polymerase sigma-70 factor (ECF subfamily)